MIQLDNISMSYGSKTLFENITVAFNQRRYGLTGPNGAGKSTLLKIMMGEEQPTTGTLTMPDKVGMLKQNIEAFRDYRVIDVVIMGNKRLWEALEERDHLYEVEMTDEVGMRLGDLEGIVAEENGYTAEPDAEILLSGMGIEPSDFEKPMHTIPTDMQFRVLLCQALFGEPSALLLDEPTNHLDMDSISWLENFLFNYAGTLIVISHDRHFLNSVCTDIADIDYESVIIYPGNYDDMVVAKTSVRDQAERDAKSKEKKISQLKEFVSKFSAGSRASQVQSRLREIERLQPQELKKSNIQRPYIRFPLMEKAPGKIVLKGENVCKSYDDIEVIKDLSFEIHRGDKIGVIGANGRGKTTLMKLLAGVIQPDSGTVELGHNAVMEYFPQNHSEVIDKETKAEAFDWLKQYKTGVYDQDIRSVMGKMLFGGDDAFKQVATLSGGETARLLLAKMMLLDHNMILLDEPNNHLDLEAVSALGWGLEDYKGTVVAVSHNRDLIEHFATKIIAFEADGVHFFEGPLKEYLDKRASLKA